MQVPLSPQSSPSHCNSVTRLQSKTTWREGLTNPLTSISPAPGWVLTHKHTDGCFLADQAQANSQVSHWKGQASRLSYSLYAIIKDNIHVCLIIRANANTLFYIILNMKYFIYTKTKWKASRIVSPIPWTSGASWWSTNASL